MLVFLEEHYTIKTDIIRYYWPNEKSVCQWFGRPGFNPRSSHIKDSKNGI